MVCLIIVCAHHAVIAGVLFFTLRVCSWCKININSSPVFARDAACLQKTRQFLDNCVNIVGEIAQLYRKCGEYSPFSL